MEASNYVFCFQFFERIWWFCWDCPKAPKTISTIAIFTLNWLLTSAAKSMYLSVSSSFFLRWWSIGNGKIDKALRVLLPMNHYHIWPIITEFPISLYLFVLVGSYFAMISLCYNIGYMAVPLISLQRSHTFWVIASECTCPLYHVEFDI